MYLYKYVCTYWRYKYICTYRRTDICTYVYTEHIGEYVYICLYIFENSQIRTYVHIYGEEYQVTAVSSPCRLEK
jgi:hypothetical protein